MDVATFAGRHQQLDTLRDLLKDGHSVRSRRVVVIHGPPGVGKSALAIRAANMCAPQFPDGQLYLNLHGATPGAEPVQAGEAIGRVLRALGVSASDVPPDVEESAALFRSLVAGRRLLMVLDNATTAGHLRNLLPGGSETAVIVTSRANLAALDGSVHLLLNPLSPVESEEVLRGLISDARMMSDVAAVRHLAQLCDHLPVALRIASARLNARPGWATADLVDLLSNEQHRLSELAIDDLAVRNSLSVSYSALLSSADPRDGAVARAFCLLGLFPGAFFDIHLAAALFDTSSRAAGRVLDRLVDAHLVEPLSPGRFHIRDLVRLYAAELAGGMSVEVRHAASARMLRQYLATAMCATRLAFPDRTPHPGPASAAGTSPVRFAHEVEARDWLRRECANMAAVGHRALLGDDELARLGNDLILTLRWFFQHAGHPKAAIGGTDDVVLAARRVDDPRRHPADDEQASPTADVPPMYR